MPSPTLSMRASLARLPWTPIGLSLLTGLIAAGTAPGRALLSLAGVDLPTPRLDLILAAGPMIQLHILAAVTAFAIGTVLLIGVKGTRLHKTLGWAWVIAMATTAISSLFIHTINRGGFSIIHLLSGWTLIALPMAIVAIRRRKVAAHRRAMTGMFVGGLLVAGAFTFFPGRLLWAVFLA